MASKKQSKLSSAQKNRRNLQFGRLFENLETRRHFAATYTVKNLFSSDTAAIPYGISNNGHVALGSSVGAAVYYNNVTTPLNIKGQANDVNDAGQVVGIDTTSAAAPVAFIYENGVEKKIPTLGGTISGATAINASGDVVGYSTLATGSGQHGFLYTHSTGKVIDLGLLPGGTNSVARGINDSGQIVGIADVGGGITHGFLYSGGKLKDLGVLPGGAYSGVVHGINNAGLIAGYGATSGPASAPINFHVVTSQAGDTLKDIGAPANTTSVQPFDVNADGTIVGFYDDTNLVARGFVESGGTFKQLDTLIDPSLKINIYDAYAINDSGTIVALGSTGSSDSVAAYLLTPAAAAPATGTISGLAYIDSNANGKQDAGEAGLAGVNVFTNGGVQTTASGGGYSYTLAPGSYFIYAGTPSGYSATTAPSANVTVTAGQTTTFSVGEIPSSAGAGKSTISGTVFNDANGNGVQDSGEAGIKGVTVSLSQQAQASIVRANALAAATTMTTDASGNYSFTGLAAGSYVVADTVPAGDTQTAPASGSYNVTIGLSGSQTIAGENFGLKTSAPAQTVSITGQAFEDTNGNGLRDQGEIGVLPGVTIKLTGLATASMVTGNGGTFTFSNLAPGTYTLTQVALDGYTTTTQPVTLDAPHYDFLPLFGQKKTATPPPPPPANTGSISGVVFNDSDGDGVRDPGEGVLSGVTITLDPESQQLQLVKAAAAAGEMTMKTGADGSFKFTGLPAGEYFVFQTPLSGYISTAPKNELDGFDVTLTAGQSVSGELFGQHQTAVVPPPPAGTGTITGTLFNDTDGDGQQDHGDVATGIRTVFIDTNGNGILDAGERSTMSDKDGVYTFANVATGATKISRVFPAGFKLSNPSADTGGKDVLVNVTAGGTATADLGTFGSNQTPPPPPPPVAKPGTITGTLFNDSDGDGKMDHGEVATGSRTVFIDANRNGKLDAGEQSTQSDGKGRYSFMLVQPGTVAISRVFPSGFFLSSASPGTGGKDILVALMSGGSAVADLGTHESA